MAQTFDSEHQQSLPQRRQAVARIIHSLWTQGGSDESGLAPVLLDGRIDVLGAYVTCHDFAPHSTVDQTREIERRHCRDLDYNDFVSTFMIPNQPVIIGGLMEGWRATQEWASADNHGISRPNLQRLADLFGNDIVPVHVQARGGFTTNRPKKVEMTLAEYANWWESRTDDDSELLYLKDWKFAAVHGDYQAYECPKYFLNDWLNGAMGHAYKFVYLGPAGTTTRLHADVLWSFSWSTNVCGRKKWYLIPPQHTHLLYDCFGIHLASHLHADWENGLDVFFPGLAKAREHVIEVVQEAGETMFVPSGWHHTVENLEPTLSINHNWLNGANIHWSWQKLRTELESLFAHSLEHCSLECNNPNSRQDQSGDSAQIGDDLLLLWYVLSKKAQWAMASSTQSKDAATNDLIAIHPILKDIKQFVEQGKDHGLTTRCHCNIDELFTSIEEYFSI